MAFVQCCCKYGVCRPCHCEPCERYRRAEDVSSMDEITRINYWAARFSVCMLLVVVIITLFVFPYVTVYPLAGYDFHEYRVHVYVRPKHPVVICKPSNLTMLMEQAGLLNNTDNSTGENNGTSNTAPTTVGNASSSSSPSSPAEQIVTNSATFMSSPSAALAEFRGAAFLSVRDEEEQQQQQRQHRLAEEQSFFTLVEHYKKDQMKRRQAFENISNVPGWYFEKSFLNNCTFNIDDIMCQSMKDKLLTTYVIFAATGYAFIGVGILYDILVLLSFFRKACCTCRWFVRVWASCTGVLTNLMALLLGIVPLCAAAMFVASFLAVNVSTSRLCREVPNPNSTDAGMFVRPIWRRRGYSFEPGSFLLLVCTIGSALPVIVTGFVLVLSRRKTLRLAMTQLIGEVDPDEFDFAGEKGDEELTPSESRLAEQGADAFLENFNKVGDGNGDDGKIVHQGSRTVALAPGGAQLGKIE